MVPSLMFLKGLWISSPTEQSLKVDLFQEKLNDPRFAIYAPVAYENPVERRELMNDNYIDRRAQK
jgi:hypothetical protein